MLTVDALKLVIDWPSANQDSESVFGKFVLPEKPLAYRHAKENGFHKVPLELQEVYQTKY